MCYINRIRTCYKISLRAPYIFDIYSFIEAAQCLFWAPLALPLPLKDRLSHAYAGQFRYRLRALCLSAYVWD